MPGMKWSFVFAVVLSASIGIRWGAPNDGFGFAADSHVRSTVGGGIDSPERRVMAVCDQGFPVHEEEADIAVFRFGEDLLSDDVAVASDGLDHLVQVR